MIKSHLPSIVTCTPPLCNKTATSVQKRQTIAFDVPLRMPTRAFLQIAAIRFMPTFAESDAHRLAFFTSDKHFHVSPLPFPIGAEPVHIRLLVLAWRIIVPAASV